MVRLPALGNERVQWLGSDAGQMYKRFVSSYEKGSCLRRPLRNLRCMLTARYPFASDSTPSNTSMNFLMSVFSSMSLSWWLALIVSGLGIAAICLRVLETDAMRPKRSERKQKKELRSLAERISSYGQTIHQRYPTGDVIVSERDLAEQLRKRPDAVITALNLLLNEQKVQKAPLRGYWKLNV